MALIRSLARPMLAAPFVLGGINQLRDAAGYAARSEESLKPLVDKLDQVKDAETLVRLNGATMLVGGALLGTGKFRRLASVALGGALVPTSIVGHAFWKVDDPKKRAEQRSAFVKNVGLLGGLLLSAVDLEGKPGVKYRAKLALNSVERGAERTRRETRRAARAAKREAKLAVAQAHNAIT